MKIVVEIESPNVIISGRWLEDFLFSRLPKSAWGRLKVKEIDLGQIQVEAVANYQAMKNQFEGDINKSVMDSFKENLEDLGKCRTENKRLKEEIEILREDRGY